MTSTDFCPCQSGRRFGSCCGALLAGARSARTAEELMRSRYTAFARGDAAYLSRTWACETRPERIDLDPEVSWRRLEILGTLAGGSQDEEGWVSFAAYYRHDGDRGMLRERSRFVRRDGDWYYVEGRIG